MNSQKPNTDQSDDGSMAGVLSAFMRSTMMGMDDMLPAQVVSYDDATNRAVLKPLITMVGTSGQTIARQSYPNIPVFRFGGGGFFMRFPIKPGDLGWIKASDRDISLFYQSGCAESQPNTERLKSFSDAMFFPDTMRDWVIDGANADAVVLQSVDGSVTLSLHNGKLVYDGPLFQINADIEHNGDTIHNGNIVRTGDTTTSGGLINNGKDVGSEHTHGSNGKPI